MEFADKVIIVTGASSGIGRAIALAFAEHGCYLAITGRDVGNLNEVAALCRTKGAKDVLTIIAEFEKMDEVETVVTKTVEKFKAIHIVVNNAGITFPTPLEDIKMDDFDRMFNVNVKSMLRITQQAMPYLLETKGNVVNISSYLAERQMAKRVVYCMTKAAVNQFTKTIALEYASKGVRVNAVSPSTVRTSVLRHRLKADEMDQYYESKGSKIPIGRTGYPEDCANAVLFLASSKSAWTTGQCMVLDGGKSLA